MIKTKVELVANVEKTRAELIAEMVTEIKNRCNSMPDGWLTLTLAATDEGDPETTVKVARIPFERWMRNTSDHRGNDWANVAPPFLKMQMDDRDHSDWWLSSGVPLEYAYDRGYKSWREDLEPDDPMYKAPAPQDLVKLAKRLNTAAWEYRFDSTKDRERNSIFLVSKRSKEVIEGRVMHIRTEEDIIRFVDKAQWHDPKADNGKFPKFYMVAVIPNCSVDYDAIIRHAGAIITEVGSAAAHVVKIAREDKIPVILCPKAYEEYFDGEFVSIEGKRIWGKA